ncbi:RsmB/NOP family class I SAM-dependent RNA methyltransferase [Paracoccus hibiscisoli]|uniref:RsmB/NOP family class I SAM-dependent RNA methyltransferase n=1 Tax=Paracoccus hibiscisoli TaxID=2023261 RepID=A0A4U0QQ06_9RHOB|nr:RsmB/NOP family class I SAM-dependent RNA methyltransferase [Paracoccus hibiscisoli]TJZ84009.1 RsmB/NOP family class I SAM-dependent RNA methyltransferase [Paracoccus hibiscisoli]
MTPAARIAAAIGVLDQILAGAPAEQALLRWSRASRFAGSGDRAALRDLVFGALRRRDSLAALGGGLSGRGLMVGHAHQAGLPLDAIFTGEGHAPAPLTPQEAAPQAADPLPDDLPDWLRPDWHRALGAQADAVAQAMTDRAPVWLRVNLAQHDPAAVAEALAAEGIATQPAPDLPSALRVVSGDRLVARSACYRDGLVELQDLSPQRACARLPLAPGMRVLDYCAGGGGKALALAARQPDMKVAAHDVTPARMADLPARAGRAGLSIALQTRPRGPYDLVVADVPCSGSGTWRRTPDAKWRLTRARLDDLVAVQGRILEQAAVLVAPGGSLAYMTCSLLEAENGAQIDGFLAANPGFREGDRQTWTPLDGGDGFFIARLVRS